MDLSLEKENRFQQRVIFFHSSDLVKDGWSLIWSFLNHGHWLPLFLHQGLRGSVVPAREIGLDPVKVKVTAEVFRKDERASP